MVEPSARILRLHQSSLDFATADITDLESTSALVPLQQVDYVERCTCPLSRIGSRCQSCAEHYTSDPSYGGEFSHCVNCFCNFQSSLCHPASGVCLDCASNTRGDNCEMCPEGYDRTFPVSFLPCDTCAMGYFSTGSGTCVCKFVFCIVVDYSCLCSSVL